MVCSSPIFVSTTGGIVPCGQCRLCLKSRRRQKSSRVFLESRLHEHLLFVTLTYMDRYLPTEFIHPRTGQCFEHPSGVLDPRCHQLFVKKLRQHCERKLNGLKLRFFMCGEYGDKNMRPHYHYLFFGLPYSKREVIFDSWHDPVTRELMCDPDRLDIQEPVSDEAVAQYCAGYITKGMTNGNNPLHVKRLQGRTPEFTRASTAMAKGCLTSIVEALRTPSAQAYINLHSDIPRQISVAGQNIFFDRYMRGKILDELQISEMAKAAGLARFKEEMSALYDRSQANEVLSGLGPKYALKQQFLIEKAGEIAVRQRKADFFERGTIL